MTITKLELSGSTDGRPIKVAATSSPGTAVHTATSATGSGLYDEVWLWAVSSDTSLRLLTVQFGGTTAPDDSISCNIPIAGADAVLIIPGLILQNSLLVKAFAAVTNVITVFGHVNRIT